MCQQLNVISEPYGYKYANVTPDIDYVWHQRCHENSTDISSLKILLRQRKGKGYVLSANLYLLDYVSFALNLSMRFISTKWLPNEDEPIDQEPKGDIILNWGDYMPAYNLLTREPFAIRSPIYDTMRGGLLSLKKPKFMTVWDVIHIFDARTYLTLFACITLVALVLYMIGRNSLIKSKLCQRSFLRQHLEMTILIAFEPRVAGLVGEKRLPLRLIIASAILTGLLMRKCFVAKLNAIFTYQSYDYVTDLNESLRQHVEVQTIVTSSHICKSVLQWRSDITSQYNITVKNETESLKIFLNTDSVYFQKESTLSELKANYPFLPAKLIKLTGIFGQTAIFYFPIHQRSPHYSKLYYWLQIAFDMGLTEYGFREQARYFRHRSFKHEDVLEIYHDSEYYAKFGKEQHSEFPHLKRQKNVDRFCTYLLICGYIRALLRFSLELYKQAWFGAVIQKKRKKRYSVEMYLEEV